MMIKEPFLKQIAKTLIDNFDELSSLTIVLPSERAGVYLKYYLSELKKETFWAPEIKTILSFIEDLSTLKKIDSNKLLIDFYSIYSAIEETPDTFDVYLKWASTMLADFNEIDAYKVNPQKFFSDLRQMKELENWGVKDWSFEQEPLSDHQINYLHFWQQLGKYYSGLQNHLKAKGLGYQGMLYREVADQLNNLSIDPKQIVFAGFNALSKSEAEIIYGLEEKGALVLHDADDFYLDNKQHEAGMFLRKHNNKIEQPHTFFKKSKINIEIASTAKNVGQAKYAASLINKYSDDKTAVLLADEAVLPSFLSAVDYTKNSLNVTMGMGVTQSFEFHFFKDYAQCIENYHRLNQKAFHHKDIISLFHNQLIANNELKEVCDLILKKNLIFISADDILKMISDDSKTLIQLLFKNIEEQNYISKLIALIGYIKQNNKLSSYSNEVLYAVLKKVIILKEWLDDAQLEVSKKTVLSLLTSMMGQFKVAFKGDAIQDTQVMGMLESRALDFENVIITSVNEDILPKKRSDVSYIPLDIKKYYGLPTIKEKDAIYAYHFYRLLQRSKNVHLIYNAEPDGLGGGEASRFITQLEIELPKYNSNITVNKKSIFLGLGPDKDVVEVKKTDQIKASIIEHLEVNSLSPSAINTFIDCPLDYYYKYVLRLKEKDEMKEHVDHAGLGTYVHDVLEELYTPFVGRVLKVEDLNSMLQVFDNKLLNRFLKDGEFSKNEVFQGKNYLIFEVARQFVKRFLELELSQIEKGDVIQIVKLEEKLEYVIPVEVNGKVVKVKISGKADRIDLFNGSYRVIDYKTGAVEDKDVKINSLDSNLLEDKKGKAQQLLCYAYLYLKNYPQIEEVIAGNYSFKKLGQGLVNFNVCEPRRKPLKTKVDQELIDYYESFIKDLVEMMLDDTNLIVHDADAKYCKFCSMS